MRVITMNQVSQTRAQRGVKFYGIEFREKHFRETRDSMPSKGHFALRGNCAIKHLWFICRMGMEKRVQKSELHPST